MELAVGLPPASTFVAPEVAAATQPFSHSAELSLEGTAVADAECEPAHVLSATPLGRAAPVRLLTP